MSYDSGRGVIAQVRYAEQVSRRRHLEYFTSLRAEVVEVADVTPASATKVRGARCRIVTSETDFGAPAIR
jgi:hypothetical protein